MKKLIILIAFTFLTSLTYAQNVIYLIGMNINGQTVINTIPIPQVVNDGLFSSLLGKPNTLLGYNITDGVPTSRTLTINGTTLDLSVDRTWTIPSSVTSVFGRTGAVTAVNGDYTTTQVTEGANLYWTTARGDARYPLLTGSYANPSWITSLAQSKITYSGTTAQYIRGDGSLATFPTNVSTFTNDAGYLTNSSGINVLPKTVSYTIVSGDFATGKPPVLLVKADATSSNLVITLPSASSFNGYTIKVTKTDNTSNTVTIAGLPSDNIIGTQRQVKEAISNSSNWIQD